MAIGGRWAGLSILDSAGLLGLSHTTLSRGYTELGENKASSEQWVFSALLMREIRR